MAFETKVILSMIIQLIAKSDTIKDAYNSVSMASKVEGLDFPLYEEMLEKLRTDKDDKKIDV